MKLRTTTLLMMTVIGLASASDSSDALHAAYQLLGLSAETQDAQQIKTAYKQASLQAHPDHGGNDEAFNKVYEAYELLIRSRALPEMGLSLLSEEEYDGVSDEEDAREQQLAELQRMQDAMDAKKRHIAAKQEMLAGERRKEYVPQLFEVLRAAGEKRRVYLDTRKRLEADKADLIATLARNGVSVAETQECGSRLVEVSLEMAQIGDVEPPAVTVTVKAVSHRAASPQRLLELQWSDEGKLYFADTRQQTRDIVDFPSLILDSEKSESCFEITEVLRRWTEKRQGEDYVEYCGFDGAPQDYCERVLRRTPTYYNVDRQQEGTTQVTYEYDTVSGIWKSSQGGDGEVQFCIGDHKVTVRDATKVYKAIKA